MKDKDDYLLLSQLTHAGYCLRRAALVINEQAWNESADTAKGRIEHEHVHRQHTERRGNEIKLFEYEVFSDELELTGKCDCIEAAASEDGCMIPSVDFPVSLYPVEFKHGKMRTEEEYEIQLCAQAMCLEEMYHTTIKEGAIFYTSSHRRYPVPITAELRQKVLSTVQVLRKIRDQMLIPPAKYDAKCKRCSLFNICMPSVQASAASYCKHIIREAKEVGSP